jgi:hypothetical protein
MEPNGLLTGSLPSYRGGPLLNSPLDVFVKVALEPVVLPGVSSVGAVNPRVNRPARTPAPSAIAR